MTALVAWQAAAEELTVALECAYPHGSGAASLTIGGSPIDIGPALQRHYFSALSNDPRIVQGCQVGGDVDQRSLIRQNIRELLSECSETHRQEIRLPRHILRSSTSPDVLFITGNRRLAKYAAGFVQEIQRRGNSVQVLLDPRAAMRCSWRLRHVVHAVLDRGAVVREMLSLVESTVELLSATRPKLVVLIEGCKPVDSVVAECSAWMGIPTTCLQQGWSPVIHSGFRNLNVTKMATWGHGFSELLRSHSATLDCVQTGLDVVVDGRERVLERLAEDTGECPMRIAVALTGESLFFDDQLLVALAVDTARRFPSACVDVRPHPASTAFSGRFESIDVPKNLYVRPSDSQALCDFLGSADLVIAGASTVLLEAAAIGVPVVAAGVPGLELIPPFDIALRGTPRVECEGELAEVVERVRDVQWAPEDGNELRERFFAYSSNKRPLHSVAELCLSLAHG